MLSNQAGKTPSEEGEYPHVPGLLADVAEEREPTEVQSRRKAGNISGWHGELGAPPGATKGTHWGMGGVSTAGLFAVTGPAA